MICKCPYCMLSWLYILARLCVLEFTSVTALLPDLSNIHIHPGNVDGPSVNWPAPGQAWPSSSLGEVVLNCSDLTFNPLYILLRGGGGASDSFDNIVIAVSCYCFSYYWEQDSARGFMAVFGWCRPLGDLWVSDSTQNECESVLLIKSCCLISSCFWI